MVCVHIRRQFWRRIGALSCRRTESERSLHFRRCLWCLKPYALLDSTNKLQVAKVICCQAIDESQISGVPVGRLA